MITKRFTRSAFVLAALIFVGSCKTGPPAVENRLTVENVQKAVDQMIGSHKTGGAISVLGIREIANGAQADLQFTDFTDDSPTAFGFKTPYSGRGTADIARYTDGRIVLTRVTWSFGTYVDGQINL